MHDHQYPHTPSNGDPLSAKNSFDPIVPIDFSPPDAARKRAPFKPRWPHVLIAGFFLLAGIAAWFVLTAKSVSIVVTPVIARVEVLSGFHVQIGQRYLMREGDYDILVRSEGYHDARELLQVGQAQAQDFLIEMRELPGIVSVAVEGADGPLSGAMVSLNGQELGRSPVQDLAIEPGEYSLRVQAERYRASEQTVVIAGKGAATPLTIALSPAWAQVSFSSEPAGAEIMVDGIVLGTSPYTAEILEGRHELTMKLPAHKVWQDAIEIIAAQDVTLPTIALERADGLVFIRSQPSGANVTINGEFRGQTPLEVALAPGRSHELNLFRSGFSAATKRIETRPNQEQDITVALEPITSTVRIIVEPPDAQLFVDGVAKGRASQTLELMAASQVIEIRQEGYVPYTGSFTSRPGLEQELRVTLQSLELARQEAIKPVITNAAGQTLTLLYPGQFSMGASRREPGRRANEDLREVRLERPFYLSPTEVTNAQFKRFRPDHSSGVLQGRTLALDNQPVVQVTWSDAALYCNWLSEQEGLPVFYTVEGGEVVGFDAAATGYRMPTEAEWEWAARTDGNGNVLRYPWGEQMPPPEGAGNFADASVRNFMGAYIAAYDDSFLGTAPVAQFPVNAHGMYDMAGNVSEWVHDFYGTMINLSTAVEVDPVGPESGQYHTIKGSSWAHSGITELRLAFRDFGDSARNDLGFRIARYLEE